MRVYLRYNYDHCWEEDQIDAYFSHQDDVYFRATITSAQAKLLSARIVEIYANQNYTGLNPTYVPIFVS